MKKISLILFVFVILIGSTIFYLKWNDTTGQPKLPQKNERAKVAKKETVSESIPTIFVHGYSGTKNSFGGMIKRLTKEKVATPSLIATITSDGEITYEGEFNKKEKNPMIQILFADNKSTEENQSWWLQELMQSLKTKYGIEKVNVVGHSMGGVALTNYVTAVGINAAYPEIEKLVLIAAPINGLEIGEDGITDYDLTENGPKMQTERFANFDTLKEKIPSELAVLTIAGDKENGTKSDGSVSVASALSAKFIYQSQVTDYREMVFTGIKASHSLLHENTGVDKAVAEFLWSE